MAHRNHSGKDPREIEEERMAQGVCIRCTRPLSPESKRMCEIHLIKQRQLQQDYYYKQKAKREAVNGNRIGEGTAK